ncbi:hemolysin family protein [Xylocopilactobacillus apicola]|uniref:CBS domain-containing protein n=1 Tax=Xylocopilactobacillus apicola TaxID=2932184 RepID=A0AAU9CVT5_9LACO|nr:CBS domain-containing protein [Xylocopilactobacillus apicola]BDR58094.1 hypothetical protein XA3_05350 [Xylocopilactobacillus apicola]
MAETITADAACILIFLFLEELFNFWRQILFYKIKFGEDDDQSTKLQKQETRSYYSAVISWILSIIAAGYFSLELINTLEKHLIVPIVSQEWVQVLVYLLFLAIIIFAASFLISSSRKRFFIATKNSEINRLGWLLKFADILFSPITSFLVKFQEKPVENSDEADEKIDFVNEDEIITLTEEAVKQGALDDFDLIYMKRAFEFNDKVATDIMVDRTSLEVIDITTTVKEALIVYLNEGYSRYPVVADNDKDKILGYVYIYDLIRQSQVDASITVSRLLRSIITMPETTPVHNLLQEMISKHTPIVIAVDEYGGTSGIITDKDIYEELFGSVRDEIDDVSDEYIQENPDQTFAVSGKTTLYDFERYFKVEIESFEESESTTIAGYISELNPEMKVNDSIIIDQFNFTAQKIRRGFITWFLVKELPKKESDLNQIPIDQAEDDHGK